MIGQVNRVFADKGYGFIKTEEGDEFFFHMSALRGVEWAGLVELCNKTEKPLVYFKEMKHNRGPRAINVELIPES